MHVSAICRNPAGKQAGEVTLGSISDLPALVESSDFLLIACPLDATTRGMIGAEQLRRMKPGALLVNVSRAEIVDEEALWTALRDGWIGGAVLDVWYRYPAEPGLTGYGSTFPFHQLPNVVTTPHYSAWTQPMIERRMLRIAENLDRVAEGRRPDRMVLIGSFVLPEPAPPPVG
jgi:phosphoglycerate dehydrogenase-like enzyme